MGTRNRLLHHVQRPCPVSLAPDTVMPAVQTVVRRVNDQRLAQLPNPSTAPTQPPDNLVNVADRGIILCLRCPLATPVHAQRLQCLFHQTDRDSPTGMSPNAASSYNPTSLSGCPRHGPCVAVSPIRRKKRSLILHFDKPFGLFSNDLIGVAANCLHPPLIAELPCPLVEQRVGTSHTEPGI